jgi:hypothetical protein
VGGTVGVMDARAAHGMGGVMGDAWGAVEVVGTARSTAEVSEAGDKGAA